MNSCIRCGKSFTHNYLILVFMKIKEERRKVLLCFNCKNMLDEKAKAHPGVEDGKVGMK